MNTFVELVAYFRSQGLRERGPYWAENKAHARFVAECDTDLTHRYPRTRGNTFNNDAALDRIVTDATPNSCVRVA